MKKKGGGERERGEGRGRDGVSGVSVGDGERARWGESGVSAGDGDVPKFLRQ